MKQSGFLFSNHFVNMCTVQRLYNNYNKVRAKMKSFMKTSIVWKVDGVICMESLQTLNDVK